MKKTNAFTLLEALLSMLLLSIIISLIYLIFNLLNNQMSSFEKEKTQTINYIFFDKTFNSDINNITDFTILENQLNLFYYNKPNITYTFNKKNVLREKNNTIDTLSVFIKEYHLPPLKEEKKANVVLKIKLLNELISTNYILRKSPSVIINKKKYYEN